MTARGTELPAFREPSSRPPARRPRLAVFFSHPTQHHSVMFNTLLASDAVEADVFYYDPGLYGGMSEPEFKVRVAWDVDVLRSSRAMILRNPLRGPLVSPLRQLNPGVITALLRKRYDAVYVAGYVSPSNWLVLALARLRRVRVLYQSDVNVVELREKAHSWWHRWFYRAFLSGVEGFLVIGDNNRAAYAELGMRHKPMAWCPYPFDAARFAREIAAPSVAADVAALRARYGIPAEAIVVVSSGKLIARKRHIDLVRLVQRSPDPRVFGLIIGSGEEEAALREAIGGDARIRITGFVNQAAMPLHYLLGSIGLIASDRDPHPLVATEMAMCGLPLIVSDQTGVWGPHDIVRAGENGFVYRCADLDAAGRWLDRLVAEPALRRRMGARSRELAAPQDAGCVARVIERVVGHGAWDDYIGDDSTAG